MTTVDWAKKVHDPVHVDTVCSSGDFTWRLTMEMVWNVHGNTPSLPTVRVPSALASPARHAL